MKLYAKIDQCNGRKVTGKGSMKKLNITLLHGSTEDSKETFIIDYEEINGKPTIKISEISSDAEVIFLKNN